MKNHLTGQPDPRGKTGMFARGANIYPGGNAPHTTMGPQSFGGQQASSSPVEEQLRGAIMRRLASQFGVQV